MIDEMQRRVLRPRALRRRRAQSERGGRLPAGLRPERAGSVRRPGQRPAPAPRRRIDSDQRRSPRRRQLPGHRAQLGRPGSHRPDDVRVRFTGAGLLRDGHALRRGRLRTMSDRRPGLRCRARFAWSSRTAFENIWQIGYPADGHAQRRGGSAACTLGRHLPQETAGSDERLR